MLACTPASGCAAKGDESRGNLSASAWNDEDLDSLLGDGTMIWTLRESTTVEDVTLPFRPGRSQYTARILAMGRTSRQLLDDIIEHGDSTFRDDNILTSRIRHTVVSFTQTMLFVHSIARSPRRAVAYIVR